MVFAASHATLAGATSLSVLDLVVSAVAGDLSGPGAVYRGCDAYEAGCGAFRKEVVWVVGVRTVGDPATVVCAVVVDGAASFPVAYVGTVALSDVRLDADVGSVRTHLLSLYDICVPFGV